MGTPNQVRRLGTPDDLAAHIAAGFFPVSARAIRREWRHKHGLAFVVIGGRALGSLRRPGANRGEDPARSEPSLERTGKPQPATAAE